MGSVAENSKKPGISMWGWAYNEEELVEEFVKTSTADLERATNDYEIILVDDGSTDRTWEIMQRLVGQYPKLKIARHPENLRPGQCFHTCLKYATKDIVFWNTVDMFLDTKDIPKFLDALNYADMVQGVRTNLKANSVYRKLTQIVNYRLIRILFGIPLAEFQNTKFFRLKFAKGITLESRSNFTNPEFAIKAHFLGLSIKEVPMEFQPRKKGAAKCGTPRYISETFGNIFFFWFKWIVLGSIDRAFRRGKIYKLNGNVWPRGR